MYRTARPEDLARGVAGEPPEPIGTEASAVGIVKWWRDEKGYGCIVSDATAPWDIWCHFAALEMDGFKSLAPGERVAGEYVRTNQESFRYRALSVRRLAEAG